MDTDDTACHPDAKEGSRLVPEPVNPWTPESIVPVTPTPRRGLAQSPLDTRHSEMRYRQARQERQEGCHFDRSEAEWRNLSSTTNCNLQTGHSGAQSVPGSWFESSSESLLHRSSESLLESSLQSTSQSVLHRSTHRFGQSLGHRFSHSSRRSSRESSGQSSSGSRAPISLQSFFQGFFDS